MTGIKNINKAEVMALKDQVEYHDGTGSQQNTGAERTRKCYSVFF